MNSTTNALDKKRSTFMTDPGIIKIKPEARKGDNSREKVFMSSKAIFEEEEVVEKKKEVSDKKVT